MFNRLLKLLVGLAAITRSRTADVMQKIEVQPGYDDNRMLDQTAQNLTVEDILLVPNMPNAPTNSDTQATTNFDPIAESARLRIEADRIAAGAQQRIDSDGLFPNVKNPPSFSSSLELINRAIELNPNGEWLHFDQGYYLAKLGKNEEAIESFTKEIELGFSGSVARSYFERAASNRKINNFEQAIADCQKAQSNTSDQDLIKAISDFERHLSLTWEVEQKKLANVKNVREMATNLAHDNSLTSEMHYNVEEISKYLTSNNPENYRDKLEVPQSADKDLAIWMKGRKSFQEKDYVEAIKHFDKQEETRRTPSMLFTFRGLCKMLLGQNAEAVTDFDRAIEINKNLRDSQPKWLHHLRGMVLTKTGEFDKAIKDFDAELKLNPNTQSHAYKGVIHKTLGNEEEAKKEFSNTWFENFCTKMQDLLLKREFRAIVPLLQMSLLGIIGLAAIPAIEDNNRRRNHNRIPHQNPLPIPKKNDDEVRELLKMLVDSSVEYYVPGEEKGEKEEKEHREAFLKSLSEIEPERLTEICQALSAAKDANEAGNILSQEYGQDCPEEITEFLSQVYEAAAETKKTRTIPGILGREQNHIYGAVHYETTLPRINPQDLERYVQIFYELIQERVFELRSESTKQNSQSATQDSPSTTIETPESSSALTSPRKSTTQAVN